jgi:hypothetical protein
VGELRIDCISSGDHRLEVVWNEDGEDPSNMRVSFVKA